MNSLITTASMLLCGCLSVLGWHEFYLVSIKQDVSCYPFGAEAAPWYYQTAEMYAWVNLVSGVLFGVLFVIGLWSIWKQKRYEKQVLLAKQSRQSAGS